MRYARTKSIYVYFLAYVVALNVHIIIIICLVTTRTHKTCTNTIESAVVHRITSASRNKRMNEVEEKNIYI